MRLIVPLLTVSNLYANEADADPANPNPLEHELLDSSSS